MECLPDAVFGVFLVIRDALSAALSPRVVAGTIWRLVRLAAVLPGEQQVVVRLGLTWGRVGKLAIEIAT